MNLMKIIIPGILFLVTTAAAAMECGTGPYFLARKANQVQMVEKHLACLKAASSQPDMVLCHKAAEQERKQQEQQNIQEQRRKLDKRERPLKGGK